MSTVLRVLYAIKAEGEKKNACISAPNLGPAQEFLPLEWLFFMSKEYAWRNNYIKRFVFVEPYCESMLLQREPLGQFQVRCHSERSKCLLLGAIAPLTRSPCFFHPAAFVPQTVTITRGDDDEQKNILELRKQRWFQARLAALWSPPRHAAVHVSLAHPS